MTSGRKAASWSFVSIGCFCLWALGSQACGAGLGKAELDFRVQAETQAEEGKATIRGRLFL
jgi:hypothetical protein